jgi:hypothetical protein
METIKKVDLAEELGYPNVTKFNNYLRHLNYTKRFEIDAKKDVLTKEEADNIREIKRKAKQTQSEKGKKMIKNTQKPQTQKNSQSQNKETQEKDSKQIQYDIDFEMLKGHLNEYYKHGKNEHFSFAIHKSIESKRALIKYYDGLASITEQRLLLDELGALIGIDITQINDNETYKNLGHFYKAIENNYDAVKKILNEYNKEKELEQMRKRNKELEERNKELEQRQKQFTRYVPRKDYTPIEDEETNF